VAVGVPRRRHAGVAERLLHHLRRHPALQGQRGIRVLQGVEADARQPGRRE